ncbi:hypothetical protein AB0425_17255 [Actinosynnema sp. NPDC051121]
MANDDYIDTRLMVHSGTDDDGTPNLRPYLQLKDDNPPPPPAPHPAHRNTSTDDTTTD